MDEEAQIFYNALQKIARGTLDDRPPFRNASREALSSYARDILVHVEANREITEENIPF